MMGVERETKDPVFDTDDDSGRLVVWVAQFYFRGWRKRDPSTRMDVWATKNKALNAYAESFRQAGVKWEQADECPDGSVRIFARRWTLVLQRFEVIDGNFLVEPDFLERL